MKGSFKAQKGVALVVTLAIVAMLTIIVVAFLSSVTMDLRTSRAYLAKTRAEYALKAARISAEARLAALMTEYPFHAIGYGEVASDEIVSLLFASESYGEEPVPHYLVSGGGENAPPDYANGPIIDLNFRKDPGDTNGWIGSPVQPDGSQTHRPARAEWIHLFADPDLPAQPNPNQPDYNPVVARYAYFVEDESSKLNINEIGNADGPSLGGSNRFERDDDKFDVGNLDLGALPLRNEDGAYLPLLANNAGAAINDRIITYRNDTGSRPFLVDPLWIAKASEQEHVDALRYHYTTSSYSNELAGTGRRRVNLNELITNSFAPEDIAGDLDDIIWVITGEHPFADEAGGSDTLFTDAPVEEGPLPDFGDRFYSGSADGINADRKALLYLIRLAANIRDYIDSDSQPTMVHADSSIPAAGRPAAGWGFTSAPPMAVGKEKLPYLQEHAWKGFIQSWSLEDTVVTADLRFDHYFELYNPYTEAITLPEGAFLKVYDMPSWLTGSYNGGQLTPPDIELDLSNVRIPAGGVVVVTTNDTGQHPPNFMQGGDEPVVVPLLSGQVEMTNQRSNERISNVRGFQLQGRSSSITDYRTQMLFGSQRGIYDHTPALSVSLNSSTQWNITDRGGNVGSHTRFVYSSSLRGNDAASRTGDPRSLSEQLNFLDYSGGGDPDQTRFYGNIQGHRDSGSSRIPGTSSFGEAAGYYIAEENWPDYNPELGDSAATAPAMLRNEGMETIGELGQIYDPHRKRSRDILYARGGARTLRIGQPDDVATDRQYGSGASNRLSWLHAAHHLADLFAANEDLLAPVAPAVAPAKININSVLRDGGMTLRAALRDYRFLDPPIGDPLRSAGGEGRSFEDDEIDAFIEDLTDYLRGEGAYTNRGGPMMSRGELGQLDFFTSSSETAGGESGTVANDRSREEIFRRSVELITTRSSSFSVYCVAQSVQQRSDGSILPLAIEKKRFVLKFEPQFNESSFGEEPAAVVESYTSKIVHESVE